MNIQFSEQLIPLVAAAARQLLAQKIGTINLPAPWAGFCVSFVPPNDQGTSFKVYSLAGLGLGRDVPQVFLICNDFLGGECQKCPRIEKFID